MAEGARLSWTDGHAAAAYLGALRWRCTARGATGDTADAGEAAERLVDAMLEGEPRKATLTLGDQRIVLTPNPRQREGWIADHGTLVGPIGRRDELVRWLRAQLEWHAHELWDGEEEPAEPLGEDFAFAAFEADPESRCAALTERLSERLADHPSVGRVLQDAALELRSLGHDLWSWDTDQVWAHDYMTRRPGAGLRLEASGDDRAIRVSFEPPATES